MRRLQNTYPGNTTLYPNGRGTIGIGAPDAGSKVLFYNETPVNLDLDFYNGNTDVLHAWEANFWTLDGEVGDITWAIDTDSLAVVNPPINAVFTTLLNPEEQLKDKAYPMPLIRQIGGQVAVTNTVPQVVNDGNTLQQVIEATLQGHTSSDVIVNNDGSYTLKGAGMIAAVGILTHILGNLTVDQASTLTGILTAPAANVLGTIGNLQHILGNLTVDGTTTHTGATTQTGVLTAPAANVLGALGILTHILGTLTVDQTSLFTGIATFTAALRLTSKQINDGAGNNILDANSTGLFLKGNPATAGKFQYQGNGVNSDFTIAAISKFSGTGSVTGAVHGLKQFGAAVLPDIIIPVQNVAGSQTMGYNTLTTTTVNIVTGAGLAWSALAVKL